MPFPDLWPDKVARVPVECRLPGGFRCVLGGDAGRGAVGYPLDARFEPVDVGLPVFDVYDVSFAGFGGHEVRGWFIAPKGGRGGLCGQVHRLQWRAGLCA